MTIKSAQCPYFLQKVDQRIALFSCRCNNLTEDIALSAALISVKHKLPMADSLIYATARARGAVLWTQDDHFRNMTGVNYLEARTGHPT